jgi:hypothetical protein
MGTALGQTSECSAVCHGGVDWGAVSGSWHLSKAAPNWLAYQLELISDFHRVRIVARRQPSCFR